MSKYIYVYIYIIDFPPITIKISVVDICEHKAFSYCHM